MVIYKKRPFFVYFIVIKNANVNKKEKHTKAVKYSFCVNSSRALVALVSLSRIKKVCRALYIFYIEYSDNILNTRLKDIFKQPIFQNQDLSRSQIHELQNKCTFLPN